MKLTKLSIAGVALVASAAAFAAQPGFFAGLTAGYSQANIKSFNTGGDIGSAVEYQKKDSTGFAYGIQGGYNVNQYYGFEVAYNRFGHAKGNIVAGAGTSQATVAPQTFKISDIAATVNGYYPVSTNISLIGKAGLAYVMVKNGSTEHLYRPVVALGASYALQPNMELAATFSHIFKDNSFSDVAAGNAKKFVPNINMLALSFNYSFGGSNA